MCRPATRRQWFVERAVPRLPRGGAELWRSGGGPCRTVQLHPMLEADVRAGLGLLR